MRHSRQADNDVIEPRKPDKKKKKKHKKEEKKKRKDKKKSKRRDKELLKEPGSRECGSAVERRLAEALDEAAPSDDEAEEGECEEWRPEFADFYDPVMAGNADGGVAAGPHDRAISRAAAAAYAPDRGAVAFCGDGGCCVFVGQLDPQADEADLRRLCEPCGSVVACRLVRDWATGHSRRYGFVRFDRPEAATLAARRCHGRRVLGRPALVDRERSLGQTGWVPRRLGGGLGGRRESGQLRFGCRLRQFRRPRQE